jgi:carbamoyl-phosphate synthase large subunit
MRSTGEVLGMAENAGLAYWKAQEAAKAELPSKGAVLLTLCERDRNGAAAEAARRFAELGFLLRATAGTHKYLAEHGIESVPILKLHEGRPNIADAIKNGEIQLVVNTPAGKSSIHDDSYVRKTAIAHNVPYITTVAAALAAAKGIAARREGKGEVRSLQEYHSRIV